jgi:hypothetical protein
LFRSDCVYGNVLQPGIFTHNFLVFLRLSASADTLPKFRVTTKCLTFKHVDISIERSHILDKHFLKKIAYNNLLCCSVSRAECVYKETSMGAFQSALQQNLCEVCGLYMNIYRLPCRNWILLLISKSKCRFPPENSIKLSKAAYLDRNQYVGIFKINTLHFLLIDPCIVL